MLLDVLSGLDELQVAVAYEDDTGRSDHRPSRPARRLRTLPAGLPSRCPAGPDDLTRSAHWADLARGGAVNYVEFLLGQIGIPVSIVSVGPERRQTILESQG